MFMPALPEVISYGDGERFMPALPRSFPMVMASGSCLLSPRSFPVEMVSLSPFYCPVFSHLVLGERAPYVNHNSNCRKKEFGLLPGLVVNFQIKEMF